MTAAVFVLCWLASAGWYAVHGPFLAGGVTIYLASMAAVMVTATAFALASGRPRLWAIAAVLVGLVIIGNTIGWNLGPPGLVRGVAYLAAASIVFALASSRWEVAVAVVLVASGACSALAVMGAFPPRPRVFTGLYYADVTAYLAHAAFIGLGRASGDGLVARLRGRRRAALLGGVGVLDLSPQDPRAPGKEM